MNPLLRSFKHNLSLAAQKWGLRRGELIEKHDPGSFELDEVAETDSVAEIAAKALSYFCVEDGRFNGFEVGIAAVMGFLAAHLKGPDSLVQKSQAFSALLGILNQGGEHQALLRWIESWYS